MTSRSTADAFVEARRHWRSLPEFPGRLPTSLEQAYTVQEMCLSAYAGVRGWKVASIRPELRGSVGAERTVGPIMSLIEEGTEPVQVTIIKGGFSAVEAEFACQISKDLMPGRVPSKDELLDAIGSLHIACEVAGSPLATLNDLGPIAAVSDHGNNLAVVVGAQIADWRSRPLDTLAVRTLLDDRIVGEGSAANIAGGPVAAVSFLVTHLAARGRSLRAGDWVSTGATTGVHRAAVGASALLDFGVDGRIQLSLTG